MRAIRERFPVALRAEEGIGLIEVIVAVAIVSVVALASASLTITGLAAASAQQRAQVAVTIANGSMETVSGWSVATNSVTTVSNLYTGRSKSAVQSAFDANAGKAAVSQTYPVWDPHASTCVPDPAVPATCPALPITTANAKQNGTSYVVTTLIGSCYQATTIKSKGTANDCGKIVGVAADPATVPTGYSRLIRVIVLVSWTAGNKCAPTACSYQTSTLVDPSTDIQWITHG
jgi:Tfp pilus assembly protein PilV